MSVASPPTMTAPLPRPTPVRRNYLNVAFGVRSWLLTLDHKRIGILYMISITLLFFMGAIAAALLRLELATPAGDLVTSATYNKLFTMHGVIMVWFFLIPSVPTVLGNFLLPLMNEKKAIRTLNLVEELTDTYTKNQYPEWNRRKRKSKEVERLSKTSSEAQTIKYADIIDNSLDIKDAETDFARVFLFECRALLKAMTRGDSRLHDRAVETVEHCIGELNK